MRRRAGHGFASRRARDAFSSRSETTVGASTSPRGTPDTSASTRCALARTKSADSWRLRAPPGGARRFASRLRRRHKASRMAVESEDGIRVLVVDDHAVVRRGLRGFLESEPDLDVVGDADGGMQALDVVTRLDAEGRRPDVV